ncbi:hypothetical protein DVT68_15560 [Dyella solisilvae]|uniref:Uncharacterized protein n=1 Tax=Dyella solisilvae TaxID=1920168 RepID=A0A370K5H5_9GAMM|nr:hypothetical protein DVT68_15560 [Dyella solisilvae]
MAREAQAAPTQHHRTTVKAGTQLMLSGLQFVRKYEIASASIVTQARISGRISSWMFEDAREMADDRVRQLVAA